MAARHEIVHIEFQANAGKANAALDTLRMEASKAKTAVEQLKADLAKAKKANLPIADIEAMEAALKKAKSVHKQWQDALNNNLKGVRALDEAIKAFNSGKGSVEGMNAALSKTAKNAAELQKNRSKEGSKTWNEMVALSKALEQNILRCNTATNQLVGTVKSGGTVSRATLTQAKTDLQQMLALENEGTNAWKKYSAQLKVIDGALTKMNVEQQQLAGKNVLAQVFRGDYITKSRTELEQMIAKLREYQGVIADPEGKGARHFNATKNAIVQLEEQLKKVKGSINDYRDAMKLAGKAAFATRQGDQLIANQQKQKEAVAQLTATLQQQKTQRANLAAQQQQELAVVNGEVAARQRDVQALQAEVAAIDMSTQAVARRKQEMASLTQQIDKNIQKEQQLQAKYNRMGAQGQQTKKGVRLSGQIADIQKETAALQKRKAELEKQSTASARLATAEQQLASAIQKATAIEQQNAAALAKVDGQVAATTAQLNNETAALNKLNQAEGMTIQEVTQAIAVLKQEQEVTATGTAKFREQAAAIAVLEEREKIMRGEALSLADALKVAAAAGGKGFQGTAKQLQMAEAAIKKASEAAKKGSPQWQKYQEALAKLKVEMQNVGMTSERMRAIIAKPANAKNLNELSAAVKRAKAELDLMAGTVGKSSKAYSQLADQTKKAEIQLKNLQSQSHGTASAFDKAWSRLKTYVGLYMGAAVAMQKFVATLSDVLKLSDKMGEVRKTTGFTADEVGRLVENLKKFDVRTDLVSLMDVAAKAGQLGLKNMEDIIGFTEAANKMMIALPEMGNEAATQIMKVALATGEVAKIEKQMREGLIDGSSAVAVAMTKVGSTIDQLRANSAAAAPAITDFVKRVGAVGAQSGIAIDQIAALGSTIDAIGLRVEMSATALSRMIPAIKNNAFAVAKAIKVEPETLRNLFETGRGMEAILMIFQHIKDQGASADDIEKMLGLGGMQEIMKELNQMGARAGIVFAGLSQNVDELRRHLGIAAEAYEENMAIEREFQKMNETTAAKWERLKNEVEEFFIGDRTQKRLGNIIDFLRTVVNLITGRVEPAMQVITALLHGIFTYWALKSVGILAIFPKMLQGLKNIGIALGFVKAQQEKLNATAKANIWVALAAGIWMAYNALKNIRTEGQKLKEALDEIVADTGAAIRNVNKLTGSFINTSVSAEKATKKFEEQNKKTENLRKEVNQLRETYDGSTESANKLREKHEELKKSEDDLKTATTEMNKAKNAHLGLVKELNSKYNTYLGYMLSEKSAALEVASAHRQIVAALKEEMIQKNLNKEQEAINEDYDEKIKKGRETSREQMSGLPQDVQQSIMLRWEEVKSQTQYTIDQETKKGVYTIPAMEELGNAAKTVATEAEYLNEMKKLLQKVVEQETTAKGVQLPTHRVTSVSSDGSTETKNVRHTAGTFTYALWNGQGTTWGGPTAFQASTLYDIQKEARLEQTRALYTSKEAGAHKTTVREAVNNIETNAQLIEQTLKDNQEFTADQIAILAQRANAITQNLQKFEGEMSKDKVEKYVGVGNDVSLDKVVETVFKDVTLNVRTNILNAARKAQRGQGGEGGEGGDGGNIWGNKQPAESTAYDKMNAEQLVARREQMNEFVKAIQSDTDIERVLKEDAALQKAIAGGLDKNFRSVVEWYNTERLKIQDELHARHLTNTGDWMDPKKTKARKKLLHDETRMFLDELDAYYTERKAKIQEAGIEEGITEAEMKNRTLATEAEWRQRRMELQKMYGDKAEEVTQKEQNAIFNIIAERTDDDVKVIKGLYQKTLDFVEKISKMGEQGEKEAHEFRAKMDKQAMQDLLKEQNAMHQQMKAIQDIIDKERPFNGITKNLRENLVTMGILTADMTDERNRLMAEGADMADFNARQAAEELKRMAFMLGEAENAYTTTIEDIMKRMADAGMTAWADELKTNPKMREALIAQLHQTYDAIQEAIKKEASLMKKQAENMWNNILLPGGDGKTTVKDAFEQVISQLGIDQGRVSRANSLIGAGAASERVADRLAIKQMQLQLEMQQHYYNLMRKQGMQRIQDLQRQTEELEKQGKLEEAKRVRQDKEHVEMSLRLAMTKEQTDLLKQQEEIIAKTEESQNRLYTSLKEWGDLLASSVKDLMEASHAGDAEYYNELAKLNLTGKGGPGAGTYIVIDNAGTEDAEAHYEYLSEREALERQHEIERENAQAEAWRKVMDDLNAKMNEQITDWINASLQNQSIDANTKNLDANTQAIIKNTEALADGIEVKINKSPEAPKVMETGELAGKDYGKPRRKGLKIDPHDADTWGYAQRKREGLPATDANEPDSISSPSIPEMNSEASGELDRNTQALKDLTHALGITNEAEKEKKEKFEAPEIDESDPSTWSRSERKRVGYQVDDGGMPDAESVSPIDAIQVEMQADELLTETVTANAEKRKQAKINASNDAKNAVVSNSEKEAQVTIQNDNKEAKSTQSTFAKMTAAANLYGAAYQTMSNDNLSASQKWEMFALQAAGQAAISMLTMDLAKGEAENTVRLPGILGKLLGEMPYPAAMATYAAVTAILGGLMGMAVSQVTKSKAQISQVTGASSASAGKLTTGMLQYGEGNVNEFTDPGTLTVGRHYNVDAADGRTYRARYMGKDAKTHLTNGPEFHLVGEKGQEAIIDAHTTRNIRMNDPEIWHSIQTLYNGGSLSHSTRRRGVRAFADGNMEDFEEMSAGGTNGTNGNNEIIAGLQASLDRNSAVLERALEEGIKGIFDVYGKGGLLDSYDTGKKTVMRHGERY